MLILLYTQNVLLARSIESETRPLESLLACTTPRRVASLVKLHRPNVVALDLSSPLVDGQALMREVRRVAPHTPLVVMAEDTQLERIEALFRWGAQSYLALPCPTSRIMKRIREASDNISEPSREPAWI